MFIEVWKKDAHDQTLESNKSIEEEIAKLDPNPSQTDWLRCNYYPSMIILVVLISYLRCANLFINSADRSNILGFFFFQNILGLRRLLKVQHRFVDCISGISNLVCNLSLKCSLCASIKFSFLLLYLLDTIHFNLCETSHHPEAQFHCSTQRLYINFIHPKIHIFKNQISFSNYYFNIFPLNATNFNMEAKAISELLCIENETMEYLSTLLLVKFNSSPFLPYKPLFNFFFPSLKNCLIQVTIHTRKGSGLFFTLICSLWTRQLAK